MIRPSLLLGAFWFCLAIVVLDVGRRFADGAPAILDAIQIPFIVLALGAAGLKVKWNKDGFELSPESKARAKRSLVAAEKKRGVQSTESDAKEVVEAMSRHKPSRILWVDDHAENNTEELKLLTELQFSVTALPSTAAALSMLDNGSFNFVISDMERDDVLDEGVTFVSAMRAKGLSIPVVIYRGRHDALSDKARAAGATDVVVNPRDLLLAIQKATAS